MLEAAVFDMDGVLIDSEPLWRRAERRIFADLGVHLTDAMCRETMGVRIDEVVRHWYERLPWPGSSPDAVAQRIIEAMVDLVRTEGEPLPGVDHALDLLEARGLRLALASSSPPALIEAVVERLGIGRRFEVVQSAASQAYGKPHPGVFLAAAERLGVDPTHCLVLEDSCNGVIAGLAARMKVVAIPAAEDRQQPCFAVAHVRLDSLLGLDIACLDRLQGAE